MAHVSARQNLRLLYAVSEELTALKDVLVNGTSIAGQAIAFAYTKGGVNQPRISGFDSIISAISSDFDLTTSTPITYTVPTTDYGAEALESAAEVEVTITYPYGLYYSTKNGIKLDTLMALIVDVYEEGDPTPRQSFNYTKYATHVGEYKSSFVVWRPPSIAATSAWVVKVTRASPQGSELVAPDPPFTHNKTKVSFTTWINASQTNYAGTALLAIWVEDIGVINKSYPQTTFVAQGMRFYVPEAAHYDPIAKTYTGAWSGEFTSSKVYTTNPSWIIYNLLGTRLTKNIPINPQRTAFFPYAYSFGVEEADLGLWSFYNFAKYCDETILGAPRYEVNNQYLEKMSRKDFLDSILSVANAKLVRKQGLLCVAWDRKLTTTELNSLPLVAAESTESGFEYKDTHLSERYTNVVVVFKDVKNNNTPITAIADSGELVVYLKSIGYLPSDTEKTYFVDLYGYKSITIELQGSSNRTTAYLKARSLLWDALVGNNFVNFSGGFELAAYHEGQVIGILDNTLAFTKKTGRLKIDTSWNAVSGIATIVFSDEVTLSPDSTVYFYLEDPDTISEEILNDSFSHLTAFPKAFSPQAGNFAVGETSKTSTTFTFALSGKPVDGSAFFIVDATPAYYTITSIDFSDDKYTLVGKSYNINKFDFVEQTIPSFRPYKLPSYTLPQPTNLNPEVFIHEGTSTVHVFVELTFDHTLTLSVAQRYAIQYQVEMSLLDAAVQSQTFIRTAQNRDPSEIFAGTLEELSSYSDTDITDALTTTYSLYCKFSFSFPNYAQYFEDEEPSVASIDAPLRIRIQPSTPLTSSGIKSPAPLLYEEVVTLTAPTAATGE